MAKYSAQVDYPPYRRFRKAGTWMAYLIILGLAAEKGYILMRQSS